MFLTSQIFKKIGTAGLLMGLLGEVFYANANSLLLLNKSNFEYLDEDRSNQKVMTIGLGYLPLQLGNRWIYERFNSQLQRTEKIKIEVISTPIIRWKTYYTFNQLPFVPGLETKRNILIRYNRLDKRYVRLIRQDQVFEEVPLFPIGESDDATFDHSLDDQKLPVANRLSYLTCLNCENAGIELVFDNGLGIIEAGIFSNLGVDSYRLKSASINGEYYGDLLSLEDKSKQKRNKLLIGKGDPKISFSVQKKEKSMRLVFIVRNPTSHLLSFNFNSSQTYDFVVREKKSGLEVWRWSNGYFFSPVLRSHALLPKKEWKFKATWNMKDNERNTLSVGFYEAIAILTTKAPLLSLPVKIVLP